jgi:hypothetical protein
MFSKIPELIANIGLKLSRLGKVKVGEEISMVRGCFKYS